MFGKFEGISFEDQIKSGKYKNVELKSTGRGLIFSDSEEKFIALEKQVYQPNAFINLKEDEELDDNYGFHIAEDI